MRAYKMDYVMAFIAAASASYFVPTPCALAQPPTYTMGVVAGRSAPYGYLGLEFSRYLTNWLDLNIGGGFADGGEVFDDLGLGGGFVEGLDEEDCGGSVGGGMSGEFDGFGGAGGAGLRGDGYASGGLGEHDFVDLFACGQGQGGEFAGASAADRGVDA